MLYQDYHVGKAYIPFGIDIKQERIDMQRRVYLEGELGERFGTKMDLS